MTTIAEIRLHAEAGAPTIALPALFLKFLRFGALAFGGPVAQIAMLRQSLVEEERWIDKGRFNRLLAVLQVLPGPEAHEMCVHMGMIARGRIGGLLAGLGFMLPGLLLMLVSGWSYMTWIDGRAGWSGVLLGVQIVVLAIILRSVVRIGEHIVENRLLGCIAATSLVATLLGVPFGITLAGGGLIYALSQRPASAALSAAAAIAAAVAVHLLAEPTSATVTATAAAASPATLFLAGLKGGLLTFGGAYTAIPYVRADTVERGWISDATFLDGIALAGVLPAPLVIFATFVGYVAGGLPGALAITAGMFLPAFAFSLVLFERLEAITARAGLQRLLEGVAAAVLGVIAATFVDLGKATALAAGAQLPLAAALLAAGLLAAWRLKGAWLTPTIVASGGLLGWLAFAP